MKPEDPKAKLGTEDFQDGVVYVARVDGLKWGPHSHYFSTSDGNHSTQTDRIGGPFIYGEDPDFDYAPEIVDYDVDPYSGPPSTSSNSWPNTPTPKVRPQNPSSSTLTARRTT